MIDIEKLKIRSLESNDPSRSIYDFEANNLDDATKLESEKNLYEQVQNYGMVMSSALLLGLSKRIIDSAKLYTCDREQFGKPIGSFQAVKHMCAEMAADLEPCYAMLWQAAHSFDHDPDEARLQACQAKSHIAEVAKMVSKKATEVHGGMGFTDLLGLHYWFKRIGLNRQILGGPELVREEAAELQGFNQ